MTISELRAIFKERSGDINLLNSDIDNFINNGIKLLDRVTEFTHAPSKLYQKLSTPGTKTVSFSSDCRVLSEVWIIDKVDGRTELEKIPDANLRTYYNQFSSLANSKPLYYATTSLRDFPESFNPADASLVDYVNYIDTVNSDFNFRGITILPPIDKEYLIELIGKFNSPLLSDTVTQNWWSINHHEMVITSSLYYFEISLRNTEGSKDYLRAIETMATQINNDTYEEDFANPVSMEG